MLNEAIRADKVRLIVGSEHTVMSRVEALRRAKKDNLDLVCVAPEATPVVCKLMDYHRETFERKKVVAKKKKVALVLKEVKEIRMKGLIEDHDLGIKCGKVSDALRKFHPVRIMVTANARMLQQRPNCLTELPNRIVAVLNERDDASFTVQQQRMQRTTCEVMLVPPKPTA